MSDRAEHIDIGTVKTERRGILRAAGAMAAATSFLTGKQDFVSASPVSSSTAPRLQSMPTWKPDPTFFPSPRSAVQGPVETHAYVVQVNPNADGKPDSIKVVDLNP
jgi:hypothetical protein